MSFADYDKKVLARLDELLTARRAELPVAFRFVKGRRALTDAPVELIVEPVTSVVGLFDCSKVFAEVQEALNREFVGDPMYAPIGILVPLEFLGRNPAQEKLEREADIRNYRSVRLRKENHG